MKLAVLLLLACGASQSQELAPTTSPQVIAKSDPEYTKEAADAKIEGTVILSTVIDTDGNPTGISIVKSLEPGLDRKAVECLQRWRFKPALHRGEPISVKASVEINFRLTAGKVPSPN